MTNVCIILVEVLNVYGRHIQMTHVCVILVGVLNVYGNIKESRSKAAVKLSNISFRSILDYVKVGN